MATTAAGTSTQVLHGNAAGAPTWGAVSLTADITGTLGVGNGGTGQTSYTDGQLLIGNSTGNTLTKSTLTAGTGISVTGTYPSFTVTNTAPDQTVAISAGTGISVSGTYPNFTVTNTAPSSGGTVTSVSGTGSVNGITLSGTVTSSGNITLGGTLSGIGNTQLTNSSITVNSTTISLGGSATITANNPFAVTFANTGGAVSGTTYDGSAAKTIDYSTVGAPKADGTGASGTWGISISGNAATVTNGVYTTGSYADPSWITSLAGSKITGTIDGGTF